MVIIYTRLVFISQPEFRLTVYHFYPLLGHRNFNANFLLTKEKFFYIIVVIILQISIKEDYL